MQKPRKRGSRRDGRPKKNAPPRCKKRARFCVKKGACKNKNKKIYMCVRRYIARTVQISKKFFVKTREGPGCGAAARGLF